MSSAQKYFAVSFVGFNTVVSVVTESYRQKINQNSPSFYQKFQYVPFFSEKSFAEVNQLLPFQLVSDENGSCLLNPLDFDKIKEHEKIHLQAHQSLLKIYEKYKLEPIPPWEHIAHGCEGTSELQASLNKLQSSVTKMGIALAQCQEKKSLRPHVLSLGEIDPDFALQQARWIHENIPVMQKGNGSGKFYQNYISFGFWHDSQQPLIKKFVELIQSKESIFKEAFEKELRLDYIYLSYVERAEEEICLWHKDGYWWDGQFHMTILGNSQILVQDGGLTIHISAENGTVWYLNGSEYYHKIAQSYSGPRYELLAPCNLRQESINRKGRAVVSQPERWIDGKHPAISEEIEFAVNHMKKAIDENRASNLSVAQWPVYGHQLGKPTS
jgi:hypothetical protein